MVCSAIFLAAYSFALKVASSILSVFPIKSCSIFGSDAKAISPNAKLVEVGIRPGEKLHEEMITLSDAMNTIDIGKYYVILPTGINKKKYLSHFDGKEVYEEFNYSSGNNDQWISVEEMRDLIVEYVDPDFKPID